MKVAINACYGGFSLSKEAIRMLYKMGCKYVHKMSPEQYYGIGWATRFEEDKKSDSEYNPVIEGDSIIVEDIRGFYSIDTDECEYSPRADKMVIEVIEKLGDKANGMCAKIKIVEIPDGVNWTIDEYDGMESIHEKHREWN